MRKIKFRGKRKDGIWVYGYLEINNIENQAHIISPLCSGNYDLQFPQQMHDVFIDSVGQYTGCKDMNGTEIYEGDYISDIDRVLITIYKVWYSEENACFMITMVKPDNDVENMIGRYDIEHHFKVIGNTFDNKELEESEE